MTGRALSVAAVLLVAWACRPDGSRADSPVGPIATPAAAQAPLQIAGPARPPAGPLALEILPQYDALHGATPLHVLVRIAGLGAAAGNRAPLDLVLVIDRSGSMSGDKLRDVKEAAIGLLARLGPADRVTLVSYSSDVRVHQTHRPLDKHGAADLRRDILALQPAGNTALGPALFTGLDVLERSPRDDARMAHVLLLSDGLANEGEARPDALAARAAQAFSRGISVSTLGVGVDYNEDLMTRLADQGGGRYHYVRNSSGVPGAVGDELAGLAATVARNVELHIAAAPGAHVERVFGYAADAVPGGTRVRVGAVAAGQTREILVRMNVDASAKGLGRFDVRFREVKGEERAFAQSPLVARAQDAEAMRASENAAVTVRIAEVESAERLEIAARANEAGNFGEARSVLQSALGSLREQNRKAPSPKLAKQIDELEEAQGDVAAAAEGGEAQKAYTKKYKARSYDSMK